MKRTLSSSRTFNNINNSSGISAADKQQITDNKNNITLLDTELTDLSANTVGGITIEILDLSSNYHAYKVSNNAALASTNAAVAVNAGSIGTLTTNLSNLTSTVGTNTSNISSLTSSVGTNTSKISSLTSSVGTNTSNINSNQNNIATNTNGLLNATQDITAIEAAAVILQNRVNQNETTLSNKQETLGNTSNITLRTLNFPDSIAANVGNLTLPGNTQLFSGDAPGGVQAKIQNGNIYNFASVDTTLLKNVTLGATWKYQNSAGYYVRNATFNTIIEYINPSDGTHNWYSADSSTTVPTKVFGWNPTLERLYCSGFVLSKKFLHQVAGTVVRGYAFFRFQGTSGIVNMNTTTGIDIPWTNVHVDGQTFLPVGTTQVKIVETGYYEIGFNVYLTSTFQRANPTIRIRVNGTDTPYLAWSYIRSASNHNESSWSLSPILISLAEDDLISVQGRFTTNGIAGTCFLYSNSATTNKAFSSLMLKRVA